MAFEVYTKKGKINNKEQSQLKQMTIGYYKPSRKKFARKTILILPQYNEESYNRALFGDIVGTKNEYDLCTLAYLQMFANLQDVDICLQETFVKNIDPQVISKSSIVDGKFIKPRDIDSSFQFNFPVLDK